MRAFLRYGLTSCAVFFFLFSGISLFKVKEYELLYSANPPIITCLTDGCLMIYNLGIGNTGRKTQRSVRLTLANNPLTHALLPPKIRNFGKVSRESLVKRGATQTLIEVGDLEAGKRVELSLLLKYDTKEEAPSWSNILLRVDSANGEAQAGHPETVTFGRVIYGFLTSIL